MTVSRHYRVFFLLLFSLTCATAGLTGCGKKALPVAPKQGTPPPVSDLSHRIEEGKVLLTWTAPEEVLAGKYGQGKLVVMRSKTDVDDICQGCPQIFQRMTRKRPIGKTLEASEMTYAEDLEKGFRYTYKVVLEMDSGRTSDDSNVVTFEF